MEGTATIHKFLLSLNEMIYISILNLTLKLNQDYGKLVYPFSDSNVEKKSVLMRWDANKELIPLINQHYIKAERIT